jgi:hypothetical protein
MAGFLLLAGFTVHLAQGWIGIDTLYGPKLFGSAKRPWAACTLVVLDNPEQSGIIRTLGTNLLLGMACSLVRHLPPLNGF